ACVTTTTGVCGPMAGMARSSAAICSGRSASRSTISTVTPSVSGAPTPSMVPDTTRSSIAPLVPKVARSCCSNAGSAVSTATTVLFDAFEDFAIPTFTYLLVRAAAAVVVIVVGGARVHLLLVVRELLLVVAVARAGDHALRRDHLAGAVAL